MSPSAPSFRVNLNVTVFLVTKKTIDWLLMLNGINWPFSEAVLGR